MDLTLKNGYLLVEPVENKQETKLLSSGTQDPTQVYKIIDKCGSRMLLKPEFAIVDISGVFEVVVGGKTLYFVHERSVYATFEE